MDAEGLSRGVHAGQVASGSSDPPSHPDFYKRPHCESCGSLLTPLREGRAVVAYLCPEHGPVHHSGIVWVWHEETE